MATLSSPPLFAPPRSHGGRHTFRADDGSVAEVFVLEEDIIRVAVLPGGAWRFTRTWAIAPGLEDLPDEGRDRLDVSGFGNPPHRNELVGDQFIIETRKVRLSIGLQAFRCEWRIRRGEAWVEVARDRPTQAYNFGWWDERVYHYLGRRPDEKYFGLGEKSGKLDRAGRRFRMNNMDALGYSARTSDPLYKHIPFYITSRPADGVHFGLFYDTLADCMLDMGCERSNYHGLYRSFSAEHGDLDYYVIVGDTPARIVGRFTWLTGRPAFMPRWSLGYSGSTMSYTDAPDAQARMESFLAQCERHDILCDSFHLSSGYTSIGENRYVFHWNREKFPDPAAFVASYRARGVRLIANIKPCLLTDHPGFGGLERQGGLIGDGAAGPTLAPFWGGFGAFVDFTNPGAAAWWRGEVTQSLLAHGVAATWNDNNEFEIASPGATADGFGAPFPATWAKPLQSLLMMRASRQAQQRFDPARRPFLVTRAGMAGMQRYAQTWSGDNATSWETLKYNIRMGLGLAMSGVSNVGHDVGGFAGPAPDAELFLAWMQFGIFMPRFSIHSWNDDGTVNEPWMHPEITGHVRELIKLRYYLIPYLYHLLWRYHQHYEPMIRPTLHEFPSDPACYEECDDMMLGPSLLVAPVVEPGCAVRRAYLPAGADWFAFWSGEIHGGGRLVEASPQPRRPILFARAGSVMAVNLAAQHFSKPAYEPGFHVWPPAGEGAFTAESFEDDGQSDGFRRGAYCLWRFHVSSDAERITIDVRSDGALAPAPTIGIVLPHTEVREIVFAAGRLARVSHRPEGKVYHLSLGAAA